MTLSGIYIHIPFCRSRCSYCDFATGPYSGPLAQRYVDGVIREIRGSKDVVAEKVDTVYLGGGTPSLLSPSQLEQLLGAVHECFDVDADCEVTMEMNPGGVGAPSDGSSKRHSVETLREFRSLGVNRASFGVQTFDNRELARLGRSHTAEEARETFQNLRDAGFSNISFDLIAGLPGQTMEGWRNNLNEALALKPEHLSFYLLEVHSGTPLAEHIKRGIQPEPDEDLAAEMYQLMLEFASDAGYEHYEISNLCLQGFESRHNTKYWTAAPYYGFGCSAHSYDGRSRWSNERDVVRYVAAIEVGESPVVEKSELSEAEVRAESIFLGLRMMKGISLREYRERFGGDLRDQHQQDLARFREAGLIELNGDLLKLTRSGALLSNEVFAAFI